MGGNSYPPEFRRQMVELVRSGRAAEYEETCYTQLAASTEPADSTKAVSDDTGAVQFRKARKHGISHSALFRDPDRLAVELEQLYHGPSAWALD